MDYRRCDRCDGDCTPGEGGVVETRQGDEYWEESPWPADYDGAMFLCPECLEKDPSSLNIGCFVGPDHRLLRPTPKEKGFPSQHNPVRNANGGDA